MSEHASSRRPERRSATRKGRFGLRLPGPDRHKHTPPAFRRFDNPASGREVTDRVTLFHDASDALFTCTVGGDAWVRLTLYQFGGSYLSLAAGLRKSDLRQLRPGTVMTYSLDASATRPLAVFARLNLRSAEQTETLFETIVLHQEPHELRFALDGVRVPFSQVNAGWLDLIFSDPSMREIDIQSIAVSFAKAPAHA